MKVVLFHSPLHVHTALKQHCEEQGITIKSFIVNAITNALSATRHAVNVEPLKRKPTSVEDDHAEPASKSTGYKRPKL